MPNRTSAESKVPVSAPATVPASTVVITSPITVAAPAASYTDMETTVALHNATATAAIPTYAPTPTPAYAPAPAHDYADSAAVRGMTSEDGPDNIVKNILKKWISSPIMLATAVTMTLVPIIYLVLYFVFGDITSLFPGAVNIIFFSVVAFVAAIAVGVWTVWIGSVCCKNITDIKGFGFLRICFIILKVLAFVTLIPAILIFTVLLFVSFSETADSSIGVFVTAILFGVCAALIGVLVLTRLFYNHLINLADNVSDGRFETSHMYFPTATLTVISFILAGIQLISVAVQSVVIQLISVAVQSVVFDIVLNLLDAVSFIWGVAYIAGFIESIMNNILFVSLIMAVTNLLPYVCVALLSLCYKTAQDRMSAAIMNDK